jgi:hypothetical protein
VSRGPIRRLASAAGRIVRPARRRGASASDGRGGAAAPAGPTIDGVRVAYAPELDGAPDPGEVVWAWVPYEEDPNQGKDRPVLIVGTDGDRFAGVPLSSKDPRNRRDAATRVPVGTGGWDRERRPSWADADRLLRFRADEIRREGSSIDHDRFLEVVARVRDLHG